MENPDGMIKVSLVKATNRQDALRHSIERLAHNPVKGKKLL